MENLNMVILPNNRSVPQENVASFDVDAEKCFTPLCPNELMVPGGDEIVDELNANAALASYRVGSKDAHSPDAKWKATAKNPQFTDIINQQNMDRHWNMHGVIGTLGGELLDGLPAVTEYDYFVWKGIELDMHPYGACYHDLEGKLSTGVIEYLNSDNYRTEKKKVHLVIVGGLATEYCLKLTVMQLIEAGFKVVVNLAACRGIDPNAVVGAIEEMRSAGAVIVKNAREIQVY